MCIRDRPHTMNVRRPLTAEGLRRLREGKSVYFSDDLCARYFTYRSGSENHYVLFDDAQTCLLYTSRCV